MLLLNSRYPLLSATRRRFWTRSPSICDLYSFIVLLPKTPKPQNPKTPFNYYSSLLLVLDFLFALYVKIVFIKL